MNYDTMTTTTYTAQLGEMPLIATCDEATEASLPWLLSVLSRIYRSTPLSDSSNVQVGWTVLTLRANPDGLLVYEPDYATDPFHNLLPDVTRSLEVLSAHAALLDRLPPGVDGKNVMFYDRVVLASGALDQARLAAQRDVPAFPGHSGWYIGPANGGLDQALPPQERYTTPFVYELLARRAGLVPMLVLPVGARVDFDGERVVHMRLADGAALQ